MKDEFQKWWDRLPLSEKPFGTAYEIIARKAWNAAFDLAAVDCDDNEPGAGLYEGMRAFKTNPRP